MADKPLASPSAGEKPEALAYNAGQRRRGSLYRAYDRFWHWRFRNGAVYLLVAAVLALAAVGSWLGYRDEANEADWFSTEDVARDGLVLWGRIQTIDLNAMVVTITWNLWAVGSYYNRNLPHFEDEENVGIPNVNLNIYQNGTMNPVGTFRADLMNNGIFQYFSTRHIVDSADASEKYFAVAPSIRYPLDTYEINAAFGARDFANNTIPIVSANLIGNLQGWQVRSNDTVMDYEGLNFSYDSGRFLTLSISRARAVVVFVVFILIVMWSVSLLQLYMALLGSIFGWTLPPNMLLAPATILFALPALRNTMPGVPAFGTYMDIYGLMLNEVVVAASFVILVVTYMHRSKLGRFKPRSSDRQA